MTVCLHLIAGCSMVQTDETVTELASMQNQHAVNALFALSDMEDIDTLIRLDNHWLESRFDNVLREQAEVGDTYRFKEIDLSFNSQIIELNSIVDIKDETGNSISANLNGSINLHYRGNGLEWRPRFGQLRITSRDFAFAGNDYAEATPDLNAQLLQGLITDIAQAVIENNRNTIPINPVPLGEIQVGATLPEWTGAVATSTRSLRGVFMVAGSAILIDSATTSIALDLSFIPDLSACPADVTVTRAAFTRDVRSREPVGITHSIQNANDARYFYSEIAGAKRPLNIIHYWFANGLPQAVAELPVGPSERWRTWSSNSAPDADVSQWEVLVVEKESGCILASRSIRKLESDTLITRVNGTIAKQSFDEFKTAFARRTEDFSIAADKPGIALIEVRRPFLRQVLQASLADLDLDAGFDSDSLSQLRFSANLLAFDGEDIVCEHRDCVRAPLCKINLAQCKRLRDTRDCSSCQFRNPLNNRCISEAVDPICEASRNRQNARYEEERNTCIAHAENAKRECDLLNIQAYESCLIESGFNESACETVKAGLKALKGGQPLATVQARAKTDGSLSAHFSNFLIEGDLERLKFDMSLASNLNLAGELNFKPARETLPLAGCIAGWSSPFRSRFTSTPQISNLLSELVQAPDMLTAHWSGFGVTVETQPSPLESVFVGKPQLLANCKIGLTVNKVEKAISGEDAAFFRGLTELVIQALPTKIHLAPASIEFGSTVYSANANLTAERLRYDIRE
jgi:hypothetical protein